MIETNISEVIGKMEARGAAMQRAQMLAARRIAPVVERDSKRVMQEEIYDIPEKRSNTGRALWVRTVRLLLAERVEVEGTDTVLVNRMEYAAARYRLGDPENPTKAASGGPRQVQPPQRSVQWQWKAAMMARAYILETRRRLALRALEGKL
jgi:hypothetical protein